MIIMMKTIRQVLAMLLVITTFEYESNGDKDTPLSIEEDLSMIRPYLSYMINDRKTQGEWKSKLTMVINYFSSTIKNIKH